MHDLVVPKPLKFQIYSVHNLLVPMPLKFQIYSLHDLVVPMPLKFQIYSLYDLVVLKSLKFQIYSLHDLVVPKLSFKISDLCALLRLRELLALSLFTNVIALRYWLLVNRTGRNT